jgi:hypothetical protein
MMVIDCFDAFNRRLLVPFTWDEGHTRQDSITGQSSGLTL